MTGNRTSEVVFADTCVLLNFVQQEWERSYSTALVQSESVDIVVSQNVVEELESVSSRRYEIYDDLIDFLLGQQADIEDYDPSDRRVYIGNNDATHVRNLQMKLSSLEDQREVLRRLRKFVRSAGRRVEHLETALKDHTIDPLAPYGLELALTSLLDHGADARIVTDAAAWTADGGSGVLVTLDDDDLFENEDEIVELLEDKQGPDWVIEILPPDEVLSDPAGTDQNE